MKKYIALLICAFLASCSPRHTNEGDIVLRDSYKLIDSGRAGDAIELLEGGRFTDDRLIALSSAYASYAGLNVQSLFPAIDRAVLQKTFKNYRNELRNTLNESNDTVLNSTVRSIKRFSLLIKILTESLEVFQRLPEIDSEKVVFLKEALMVANEVKNPSKGIYLYKAVLRLALMKYEILHESFPQLVEVDEKENCNIRLSAVAMTAFHVKTNTREILDELKFAFPRQEKNYEQLHSDISNVTETLMNAAFISDAVLDAGSIFELNIGFFNSLGENLVCER